MIRISLYKSEVYLLFINHSRHLLFIIWLLDFILEFSIHKV